jgi:hypothetical protein
VLVGRSLPAFPAAMPGGVLGSEDQSWPVWREDAADGQGVNDSSLTNDTAAVPPNHGGVLPGPREKPFGGWEPGRGRKQE